MVPEKPSNQTQFDLFRLQLDNIINRNHELYRLAEMIDWSVFDESFGSLYCPNNGCPGKPTRLMVGLQMRKHMYGMSDEEVVDRWVENPYCKCRLLFPQKCRLKIPTFKAAGDQPGL